MAEEELSESQISTYFSQMQQEQQAISQKINELEVEVNEHNLVIVAIEKLEPTRKCFRLIGGVLVERTVEEVLPAVKKNVNGLNGIIKQLQQQLEKRSEELNDFIVKHKIQMRGGTQEASEVSETQNKSSGVLV